MSPGSWEIRTRMKHRARTDFTTLYISAYHRLHSLWVKEALTPGSNITFLKEKYAERKQQQAGNTSFLLPSMYRGTQLSGFKCQIQLLVVMFCLIVFCQTESA